MKNFLLTILFLFLLENIIFTQNLVKNPSFEQVSNSLTTPNCDYSRRYNFDAVTNWSGCDYLTPDILTFNSYNNPQCFPTPPKSGKRMAGLITYHPMCDNGYTYDYHEFIRGEFQQALVVGKTYTFEIWLYSDDTLPGRHLQKVLGTKATSIISVYANNFGVAFRTDDLPTRQNWRNPLSEEKGKYCIKNVAQNPKGQWKKFQFLVQADKPYRYFYLGNFFTDAETKNNLSHEDNQKLDSLNSMPPKIAQNKKIFWQLKKRIAYICIDDVSMREGNFIEPEPIVFEEKSSYTFKNLVFETGKAKLVTSSTSELDALFDYLKEKNNVKILIEGHTDNKGSEKINNELSAARANTVKDYLLQKGISINRLQTSGLGSSKPIVTNDSEEGRQQNRRVEVKFL